MPVAVEGLLGVVPGAVAGSVGVVVAGVAGVVRELGDVEGAGVVEGVGAFCA